MLVWPMYVLRAFVLTPAAIMKLAYVWRHWCNVIGSRPAFFHAWVARQLTADGLNGWVGVPKTKPRPA